jgi:hypothetical protein
LDCFVGIDRLVAEGDVDVAMACDDLRDVRGKPAHDGVGDEHPAEVVWGEVQWASVGGIDQAGICQSGIEHVADGAFADPAVLDAEPALQQPW